MAHPTCRRKVASTPEKLQTLVRNRVSQKRWHVAQVLERELVNAVSSVSFGVFSAPVTSQERSSSGARDRQLGSRAPAPSRLMSGNDLDVADGVGQ